MRRLQVGVIGSAGPEEYAYRKPRPDIEGIAEVIGFEFAKRDCIVVTGGKGGVMEAASRGAKRAGGITMAEISGLDRGSSNQFIDVEVITGDIAFRGPSQLVAMSDCVVAVGGGAGTLQEICVAYRLRKPIVLLCGYGGWTDRLASRRWLDERRLVPFTLTRDPRTAVEIAINLVKSTSKESL